MRISAPFAFALTCFSVLPVEAATVEELTRKMEAMEAEMRSMRQELNELRAREQARQDAAPAGPAADDEPASDYALADPEQAAGILNALEDARGKQLDKLEEKFVDQTKPVPTVPNLEAGSGTGQVQGQRGVISASEDLVVSFGGFARTDLNWTDRATADPDAFLPRDIAIRQADGNYYLDRSTTPFKPTGAQSKFTARTSRLNFEVLGDTRFGVMKAFVEGDFAGSGNSLRLRHAYGEVNSLLVGQTWGTFMNMAVIPDMVNFGLTPALPAYRTPVARYTVNAGSTWQWRLALEESRIDSTTDFNAVQDVSNDLLDFLVSAMNRGDWGNVQIAGAIGNVRVTVKEGQTIEDEPARDSGRDKDLNGYALSLSGVLNVAENDKLQYLYTFANGLSQFIGDLDGQGAVADFDRRGSIEMLDSDALYLAYTHAWGPYFSSTATWSRVEVEDRYVPDLDRADPAAKASYLQLYSESEFASINLFWRPDRRLSAGIEYMWGERKNLDGRHGNANRINMMAQYSFE